MATAQGGVYAFLHGDGPATAHLLDFATDIGAALVKRHHDGFADVPAGALAVTVERVDSVADHVEVGELEHLLLWRRSWAGSAPREKSPRPDARMVRTGVNACSRRGCSREGR
ncbi:hypothetical protein [Streptomyces zagrosensis]|uniref:Uncharacterized protein n=1 Tax=Streptomyces zagrosensis TaxID=1042984 RepID=A0A7W9QHC6_9ACTN|nr:hypothetical protein [Streptomyces zagrosensis]MBB5940191.1 hypothetical protein [Streptomyces zagrosensis]